MTTLDYQYAEWMVEWLAWKDVSPSSWVFYLQQLAMENFWDGPEHDSPEC